jgi:teichoic acid transport system permease protein
MEAWLRYRGGGNGDPLGRVLLGTRMTSHPDLIQLGRPPALGAYLRAIWSRREFAVTVPLGELKAQNMDTVLGGLWHLLNPLLLVGVYYTIFGLILNIGDRGTDNFIAFLTVGIFTFFYTRKSLQSGAKAIVSNLPLIRSIRFPRAVLPISAVVGETVALVPAVAAMLAVVIVTGEAPHFTWLLLAPVFALQAAFNLGLAFFVARLTDHFRDTERFLPYLLQIWFYLSGVLYSVDYFITDPVARSLFVANPAYVFVTLAREAVLHAATSIHLWLIAAAWSTVVLCAGFAFFRAREQDYGHG